MNRRLEQGAVIVRTLIADPAAQALWLGQAWAWAIERGRDREMDRTHDRSR